MTITEKPRFEFALVKDENGDYVVKKDSKCNEYVKQYPNAKYPEYATPDSAGCDFFAAEDIVIPSVFNQIKNGDMKPTLVHTGIKAYMPSGMVLTLENRSSNPGKKNLILANSIGIVDKDYYSNKSNDGEIMFAFYNVGKEDIVIKAGDKLGQGVFLNYALPDSGFTVESAEREGGFGSTDK